MMLECKHKHKRGACCGRASSPPDGAQDHNPYSVLRIDSWLDNCNVTELPAAKETHDLQCAFWKPN